MDDKTRSLISSATVTVIANEESDSKGRGFLLHGGYVITASHCVPWSGEGQMALGDHFLVTFITADGVRLRGQVVAVDHVSDIAVIGSPDDQTYSRDAAKFEHFVESTEALVFCKDEYPFGEKVPIHIFSHKGEWLSGNASQWRDNASTLFVETRPPILGGTSGSAILNDSGEVVGVVSTAVDAEDDDENIGTCARPCQCLPMWVYREIVTAEHNGNDCMAVLEE